MKHNHPNVSGGVPVEKSKPNSLDSIRTTHSTPTVRVGLDSRQLGRPETPRRDINSLAVVTIIKLSSSPSHSKGEFTLSQVVNVDIYFWEDCIHMTLLTLTVSKDQLKKTEMARRQQTNKAHRG